MKSINKLREIASRLDDAAASVSEHGFSPIAIKASLLCDEIEAEIERDYMKLPVDADGSTDSRERLESDIDWWLNRWPGMAVSIAMLKAEVLKWIDRAFLLGRASLDDELAELQDDLGTANGALEIAVKNESTLETICAELKGDLERAENERDALAHDLEECEKDRDFWKEHSKAVEERCKDAESERERWREGLGEVTDAAAEIQRIMDRFCTSGKGAGACQSPANGRCARNRVAEGGKPDGGGSSGVYAMPRQQITTDYMQTE